MELVQEFVVPRPVDTAWSVLTDIERIAPCMPGAQLQEVEGDTYRGVVRVKVGPVVANFAGHAQFRELDKAAHRVVLQARGKEARGQGLASALITAQLTEDGEQTRVQVVTDMTISGRLAQFGRGAIAEISEKLLGQFVDCLESTVLAEEHTSPAPAPRTEATPVAESTAESADESAIASAEPESSTPAEATQPRRIHGPDAKPVDLIQTAGGPILKRLIPVVLVVAAVVVVIALLLS